jgi:GTPase SAR1 family protein
VPTIGLNIEVVWYRNYELTLWDVGGGKQASRLWKHYFDSIDLVIFVIDSSDKKRLFQANEMLGRVVRDPLIAGVPFLLMFNKKDLETRMTQHEIEAGLNLEKWFGERTMRSQLCSAKTGEGIWEGLNQILEMWDDPQSTEAVGNATPREKTLEIKAFNNPSNAVK